MQHQPTGHKQICTNLLHYAYYNYATSSHHVPISSATLIRAKTVKITSRSTHVYHDPCSLFSGLSLMNAPVSPEQGMYVMSVFGLKPHFFRYGVRRSWISFHLQSWYYKKFMKHKKDKTNFIKSVGDIRTSTRYRTSRHPMRRRDRPSCSRGSPDASRQQSAN